MTNDKWDMHFQQFRTRTEVRSTLTSTLTTLMEPASGQPVFPAEIGALSAGNDREVMKSYVHVKSFCDSKKGNDRRSMAATIGGEVRGYDARKSVPSNQRKNLKIMARDIQLAVGAAKLALEDSGLLEHRPDPKRFGIGFGASMISSELGDLAPSAKECLKDFERFDGLAVVNPWT